MARNRWRQRVAKSHSPRVVHVTPIADLKEHLEATRRPWGACWCGPQVGRGRINGRRFYLVVHNAEDAREAVEKWGLM